VVTRELHIIHKSPVFCFTMVSVLKDLSGLKSLLDGNNFEKMIIKPIYAGLVTPIQKYILSEVVHSVIQMPITQLDRATISKIGDSISNMNSSLTAITKVNDRLARSLDNFTKMLKIASVVLSLNSALWIVYLLYNRKKYNKGSENY
jgi:hypothetical protein